MEFSIIIPYYNSAKHLDRLFLTLDDYINKQNCEIIIVDDCSKEEQYSLLSGKIYSYGANNLKLLRNEVNNGPAYTRQKGVNIATGKYIAFLDADDGWVKDRVFKLYNIMEKYNLDIIGGFYPITTVENFKQKRNIEVKFENELKIINFSNFLFKNQFATSTVIVNRNLFLEHNFNTSLRYSEDFECWRRIVLNNKAMIITESGAFCFKHPYLSKDKNSLSTSILKMSKGEIQGLFFLFSNPKVPIHLKFLIPYAITYSTFKSSLRLFRSVIK